MAKPEKNARLKLCCLFGGRSGEHEVSVISARSLMKAADPARYEVVPVGITKEGIWKTPAGEGPPDPDRAFAPDAVEVTLWSAPGFRGLIRLGGGTTPGWERQAIDVVFPVLHGTFGEDGTVQGLIEMAGLPYVGSGVLGSAAAMDKDVMKRLFARAGLPQVRWLTITAHRWRVQDDLVAKEIEETLGYPCFVKPTNLGSSVGISKVHGRGELGPTIETAARYDHRVIIEEGVAAREIECALLGNDDPETSVLGEIVPCKEFYDYEAKYLMEGSELLIPAPLPDAATREAQTLAVRAFEAVGASGLARVDFFVEKETGRILVNEINTLPGFTEISMYPKLWDASGLSYRALIDRLVDLALSRHAE
ncbi:MAG: D-alanine--D-alanine ligase family protein, partial [Deltaproteobacteria bacterium]|nr:D-alanine--D-alanine ligase family protein [Deltaproteobacteria bacterium]